MKRFQNILLNLQKKRLNEGQNIFGNTIGVYSPATEEIARQENPRKPKIAGEPFNFEYTGGFFDGMKAIFSGDEVTFTSSDSKTSLITEKWDNIFGQSDEDLQSFVSKVLYPAYMIQFRSKLLL